MLHEQWQRWAEVRGYRIAFGGPDQIAAARDLLEELRKRGELSDAFFRTWLGGFTYLDGARFERPPTLILVAVPRPAHVLAFDYRGKTGRALIPPTYAAYRPTNEAVCADARAALAGDGCRIELLRAPLKTLAVWTGLARYGRNSLAYVPGLGSYVQLVGLLTDMPPDPARRPRGPAVPAGLADRCAGCRTCRQACPREAIGEGGLLLRPERCYTLVSETPGEFPPNISPPSPDCLVGCLECQRACPMNRGCLRYEEAPFALTREETEFLMSAPGTDAPLWETIREKFETLHLSEDLAIYARNFRRLVESGVDR